jgi:hypothetical protein
MKILYNFHIRKNQVVSPSTSSGQVVSSKRCEVLAVICYTSYVNDFNAFNEFTNPLIN